MAKIEAALRVEWEGAEWQPVYHADGFTFLQMPVITMEHPQHIQLMHWGLIPHWVKTKADADKLKAQTLNARGETVFEKPSFRSGITHHRCLVPADGFFEWMDFAKKKYPHYVYFKRQDIFCFAGIHSRWTDFETGEVFDTFSIITTEANPLMARIHNVKLRMPVILPASHYAEWLSTETSRATIASLLCPYPDSEMAAHTISKRITSRFENSDVPEVVEPFVYPELALL
jgi:putative SOS response-associated peptidase YedK